DANHIIPGQQIVIPGSSAPGVAATVPTVPTAAPPAIVPTAIPPTPAPVVVQQNQPTTAVTTSTGERTHTVQPGEGLSAIARKYGLSWPTVAGANNITDPNRIYAGMVLKIPAGDIGTTTMENSLGVPPGPVTTTAGKTITVLLSQQRVFA